MQNFYELENLIEKKKLDEMGVKYMGNPREIDPAKRSQYIPSIDVDQGGSDGYVGRGTRTNTSLGDDKAGKELDKQVQQANWDAAVEANPEKAIFEPMRAGLRADKKAASAADTGVGLQHVIRKGTGVKTVVRTSQNDMRMKLGEMGTPESMNALKVQAALFQPQYFGKTFEIPELFKVITSRTNLDIEEIKPALKLLQQVAGNQLRIFKGVPYPKLHIVNPFTIGGAGSTQESPEVDAAEDALTGTGSAQYATSRSPDPGPAGDQYRGRSSSTIGGPQNLAPQVDDKWAELKARANKAVLDEMPDPKEIKHLIDDLNNHVNDLKSTATENPNAKAEIEEADGFVTALEEMIPQREWLEIFESMCHNGI